MPKRLANHYYLIALGIVLTGTLCQYIVYVGKDEFISLIEFPHMFPSVVFLDLMWLFGYVSVYIAAILSWNKIVALKKEKYFIRLLVFLAVVNILWISAINVLRMFDVATLVAFLFLSLTGALFRFLWGVDRYYAFVMVAYPLAALYSSYLVIQWMILNPDFNLVYGMVV